MYGPTTTTGISSFATCLHGLFGWGAWKSLELQALPVVPYGLGFLALVVGFKALSLSLVSACEIF
jgi:hypothetical protein